MLWISLLLIQFSVMGFQSLESSQVSQASIIERVEPGLLKAYDQGKIPTKQ